MPEVEAVRRSLERLTLGARVARVTLLRAGVVRGERTPAALLEGATIGSLRRRGKHLAIVAEDGRALEIHLGMSGSVACVASAAGAPREKHTHAEWTLRGSDPRPTALVMRFVDPRRFGGLWTFPTVQALERERWTALGPDALEVAPEVFADRVRGTRRAIKAALLDQSIVAGVGNIYADESLFEARLDPRRASSRLTTPEAMRLHGSMLRILHRAVEMGGSTLADGTYTDAAGASGVFQQEHRVYGRAGQACMVCSDRLRRGVVAGRTTVWCRNCQRR